MKKGMQIVLCVALCFVFLMTGIFVGRSSLTGSYATENSGSQNYESTDPSVANSFHENKININTAGIDELVLLPNIGQTLAQRIIAYRETHGRFNTIDEITNVEGIGETRLSQIRNYITVGGLS